MRSLTRTFICTGFVALAATSIGAGSSARADVTVINQTNETLVVARGWHVNGKVVYGGWKVIHNGDSELVYRGNEKSIILCVMQQRRINGERVWRNLSNNTGKVDLEVTDDAFSCEHEGGPLDIWKFKDQTTGQEFFKDVNNKWSVPGMFTMPFFIVPGNMNQSFDP